jgi:dipeptidyl aminopeptidase/acylaminoacyl peptidase
VFQVRDAINGGDLVTLRLDGPLQPGVKATGPAPYIATSDEDAFASLSPDGRWVAFSRRKPGQNFRPHVSRFPAGEGLWLAAPRDARVIRWSDDGRRLFVRDGRTILAVPVDTRTGVPVFGAPMTLYTTTTIASASDVAVSPDGRWLAVLEAPDGAGAPQSGARPASDDNEHVLLGVGWVARVARTLREIDRPSAR